MLKCSLLFANVSNGLAKNLPNGKLFNEGRSLEDLRSEYFELPLKK